MLPLAPIPGGHLDVVFGFEQRPDTAADQRLVVGQRGS